MRIALLVLSTLFSVLVMAQDPAVAPATPPGEMAVTESKPTPKDPKDPPAFEAKDLQGMPEPSGPDTESNLKKLIQPFTYDKSEHPRDPFRLPEIPLEPMSPGPVHGPFSEMHEIPLEDISVKGIILNPTSSKAIIAFKPPGSEKEKSVVLKVGDPIGPNFGRVKSIRDGKIVILQTLEENGVLSTTTHVLSVRKYNLKK